MTREPIWDFIHSAEHEDWLDELRDHLNEFDDPAEVLRQLNVLTAAIRAQAAETWLEEHNTYYRKTGKDAS